MSVWAWQYRAVPEEPSLNTFCSVCGEIYACSGSVWAHRREGESHLSSLFPSALHEILPWGEQTQAVCDSALVQGSAVPVGSGWCKKASGGVLCAGGCTDVPLWLEQEWQIHLSSGENVGLALKIKGMCVILPGSTGPVIISLCYSVNLHFCFTLPVFKNRSML